LKGRRLAKNKWYEFCLTGFDFQDSKISVRLLHSDCYEEVNSTDEIAKPIIFKSRLSENNCFVSLKLFVLSSQYKGNFIIEFEFTSFDKKIREIVRTADIEIISKLERSANEETDTDERPKKRYRHEAVHGMLSEILTSIESLKASQSEKKEKSTLQMFMDEYLQNGPDWLRDQMKHLDYNTRMSLPDVSLILNPLCNVSEDFMTYF